MSSSNPFGFVSGMFLEIGAVVAVLAILWQPSAGDTRPAVQPDFFASQPVRFTASPAAQHEPAARTALVREEVFAYRPLPVEQPAYAQQPWRDNERLLPSAPPSWERYPQEMPQENRVATAQPYVRTIASDRPMLARQPQREYAPATYRTADRSNEGRHSDFYHRY